MNSALLGLAAASLLISGTLNTAIVLIGMRFWGSRMNRRRRVLTYAVLSALLVILLCWAVFLVLDYLQVTDALSAVILPLGFLAAVSVVGLNALTLLFFLGPLAREHRLARELRTVWEKSDGSAETFPDLYFSLNPAGDIIHASPLSLALLGRSLDEVLGRPLWAMIPEKLQPLVEEMLRELSLSPRAEGISIPIELFSSAKGFLPTVVTIIPRWDKAGVLCGFDGVVRGEQSQLLFSEEVGRQTNRLRQLFELAMMMGSSLALEELLDRVLDIIQHAVGYDSANIFVRQGETYRCVATRGYFDAQAVKDLSLERIAAPQLETLRRERKPIIIPDVTKSETWTRVDTSRHVRCWMGVPLIIEEQLIGVINLNSRTPDHYVEEDAQWMATIAPYAAGAVYRATLFAQIQEQAGHLRTLNARILAMQEAIFRVVSADTIPELIKTVESAIRVFLPLSHPMVVSLTDEEAGVLRHVSSAKAPQGHHLPELEAAVSLDMESLQNLHDIHISPTLEGLRALRLSPEFALQEDKALGPHHFLEIPLWSRGRLLGVMTMVVEGVEEPEAEVVEVIRALGDMTAISLDNLLLIEDLRATRDRLDNTLASSGDAILVMDAQGKVRTFNPAAERLFGVPAGEIIGEPLSSLFPETFRDVVQELLGRVITGEQVEIPEKECVFADVQSCWITGSGVPVRDSDGAIIGALFTLRDVTRERVIKRQIEQADRLSALGQIVAGVAHELNNPLTSIIGFGQMLLAQELDAGVRGDVERIVKSAKRMARIVQNLLVFARDHEPEMSATDINAILRQVLEMREHEMNVENIVVETYLDPALPIIRADPYQLQQVFFNLVLNAEQAMTAEHESGKLTVWSGMSPDGAHVRVEIRDTGPGIPPDNLKRIFDPFFTTKGVGKGTGLGLSVCYGIVEEHGGHIWCESEPGQGARFIVELPLSEEQRRQALQRAADVFPHEGVRSTLRHSILVVDDEESITDMLERVLRAWGYDVQVSDNAADALSLLRRREVDLILCDLKMPGMMGPAFYERLQQISPSLVERVAFMTGDTVSSETHAFLEHAGRPTLRKPFSLEDVQSVLSAFFAGKPTSPSSTEDPR